jgi:hypothetical protein
MGTQAAIGRQFVCDLGCAALSAACIAHCLLSPIIASAPALVAVRLGEEGPANLVLAAAVIASSFVVIWISFLAHRVPWPSLVAAVGLILIVLSLVVGEPLGESVERILTIIGGSLLIAGHFLNFRCRKRNRIAFGLGLTSDDRADCECGVCNQPPSGQFTNEGRVP